ncbi:unnamed protein product [Calicophoron daubneyi]|uniref:Leucine-rich repeat and WD repeat-containing protein 1 n=1 Tax=Calicophoron daubneyi TaxID=300641 RepID=A0AAV2T6I6_CALDB
MSELLEELAAHGFEIVKDESGQDLVKLVFMDENDEATGYALVSPEDAKKILTGEATLQNVVDEEGKQVLTLAPVAASDEVEMDQSSVPQPSDIHSPSSDLSGQHRDVPSPPTSVDSTNPPPVDRPRGSVLTSKPQTSESADVEQNLMKGEKTSAADEVESMTGEHEEVSEITTIPEGAEQFTLSEQTAVINNKSIQVVTLMDAQGQVLDQKQGVAGEEVVLEMHGQMFSYELQGPSPNGDPITSTLLVSSADVESEAAAASAPEQQSQEIPHDGQTASWTESAAATTAAQEAEGTQGGQQFTLTETVALVDGEALQSVILTDENGNVLDQKQGRTGEHVIIEMSGNSLEYVFLGPTETGEPITTTLVVTTDPEAAEMEGASGNMGQESSQDSEALLTAASWCPPGLPPEFYGILCRQSELIVATRVPHPPDGGPAFRPEPYHRKLGPLSTYQDMVQLVNTYRVGASQGEALGDYDLLRNYAKIYRPSGPHSRALTKYELALNEAAAQICRYEPGLLFHKRELFHLAKETVERSQTVLSTGRRVAESQSQLQGHPSMPKSQIPQPPRSVPQTAAVGGRVASSQLALLESRGLSGIKQPATNTVVSNFPTFVTTANTGVTSAELSGLSSVQTASVTGSVDPSSMGGNKMRTPLSENSSQYGSGMSLMKREGSSKLTTTQEEALRVAALDVLFDLPRFELKSRIDCTNIELSCWEQARQLIAQTPSATQSMDGIGDAVSALHSSLHALVYNELRVNAVRDAAALYGRNTGGLQPQGIARSPPAPVLIPYEVACNEAAAYLASAIPALLTHRRELAELAKKVVRNSGCLFTNTTSTDKVGIGNGGYRFYCSDQLPELDLSAADQLLTDPLDRSDSPDSGCCLSPAEAEAESLTSNLQALALSCEECNNVIDDVTIYTATGTDSLRKVRILNLNDCGFTGMIPMHLNQCSNLIELNLSGNALYAFPRCLHLPKLKRLYIRNNPRLLRPANPSAPLEPPLIEQFPRLVAVEMDPELATLLSRQSLAYLCPHLKSINGEDFNEEPTEDTLKAVQAARNSISTLIYSKWEDDIAGFYKKGLPKRDAVRVIETLVLHTIKRSPEIAAPFAHCTSVVARRVAEDMLAPKMLDDECEDETAEKIQHDEDVSDDEDDDDSEVESESEETKASSGKPGQSEARTDLMSDEAAPKSDSAADINGKDGEKAVSKEGTHTSVAEREAEAAAANLALLPDEPPDRLINVVGQALRHGKTVVYAVIRTAARQPNGELIPVGGGQGITSSTSVPLPEKTAPATPSTNEAIESHLLTQYEDEMDQSDEERPQVPAPKTQSKPPAPQKLIKNAQTVSTQHRLTPPVIQSRSKPATDGSKRPSAAPSRTPPTPATVHYKQIKPPTISTPSRAKANQTGVVTLHQRRLLPCDYIIRPSTSASEPAYVIPSSKLKDTASWTPGRRGRPPVAVSSAKKAAVAQAEAAETSKLIENVPIPPPHEPPPPTMRMATRDSNRLKRFSAYGVIDTAAARAGKEEALLAAALAVEDQKETDAARLILQQSAVVLTEEDTAIAEAAAAKAKENGGSLIIESPKVEPKSTKKVVKSVNTPIKSVTKSKSTEESISVETAKKARRRTAESTPTTAVTPSVTVSSKTPQTVPASPASTTTTNRKRTSKAVSPKPTESKRAAPEPVTPVTKPVPTTEPVPNNVRSLSQLGRIVDYDPLHFIRCHARDNDPLDCETKVWRCAFEPSVNDPYHETSTVVATCGGECVCLIDCRSGRVMKRFKHFGEEFYTLAWTTVEMAAGHKTNLLAAAGKLHEIRLLHPEQLVCYAEMRGHKEAIACMIFHPNKPTILFSGDSKAVVLVWDIGIPSAPEYRTRHQLLMRLVCPRSDLNPVLNLIFLPKYDALVAGCEDGVFSWALNEYRREKLSEERQPDLEIKIPTHREPCFDGLAKLTEDLVVVKCVEEGEIYVFDYAQVAQRGKRAVKKVVNAEVRGQLRWQTTDEIYINVTARQGLNAVVCGDNEGTIWLYDLQKQVDEDNRKFKSKPVKILEWPECSIAGSKDDDTQLKESITSGFKNPVVNTTDISHDGQYLVAVTDNNLVCIWKFSG